MIKSRTPIVLFLLVAGMGACAAAYLLWPDSEVRSAGSASREALVTASGPVSHGELRRAVAQRQREDRRTDGTLPGDAVLGDLDWQVFGTVRDSNGDPLVGAEVSVVRQLAGYPDVPMGTAVTGADGGYSLALADMADLPRPTQVLSKLLVEARAPLHRRSFLPETIHLADRTAAERAIRVNFTLNPGGTARIRVVDEDGRPVRGANLSPRGLGQDGWPLAGSRDSETGHEGWYVFNIVRPGQAEVVATSQDGRKGTSEWLEVDPERDVTFPDLVLRYVGAGELRGRVVDPAGRPVAGEYVKAVAERFLEQPQRSGWLQAFWRFPEVSEEDERVEETEGDLRRATRTDAAGRFHIRGLRPGRYFLIQLTMRPEPVALRSRPLFMTGSDVTLECRRHRLQVRVRDEQGEPVPGVSVNCSNQTGTGSRSPGQPSDVTYPCEPGETYKVWASGPGIFREERTVTIVEGQYETVVYLIVRESDE